MKEEKEVLWMVNLLNSKFTKKKIGASVGGCKSEFEKVAEASQSNKEFKKWFDELFETGVIEFFERKSIGRSSKLIDTYIINGAKLYKRLKKIKLAKDLLEMGIEKETFLGL